MRGYSAEMHEDGKGTSMGIQCGKKKKQTYQLIRLDQIRSLPVLLFTSFFVSFSQAKHGALLLSVLTPGSLVKSKLMVGKPLCAGTVSHCPGAMGSACQRPYDHASWAADSHAILR